MGADYGGHIIYIVSSLPKVLHLLSINFIPKPGHPCVCMRGSVMFIVIISSPKPLNPKTLNFAGA